MALSAGTKLGPYEIIAPLGAGGMGEVYRARDIRLERIVAIKILPAQFTADHVSKQRFEREAKTISSLNHPHICVLYDIGHQEGVDYIVMECVEGETLAKRLEKGPLPLDRALKYGAQIAEALDKAHRSGIVHRDLKPGNIMLTPTGAKLLDFGLAKPTSPIATLATLTSATPQRTPLTQEGMVVGTFQYMSPEQVEGKELDGRSDIFSLGAVLYEMLTGKRAFDGKSQLSVASAILEKEPAAICSAKPMTPAALEEAVRRCLAKDPEERWQTARDLNLELKWIAQSGSQPARELATTPSNKKMWWFLAAVAVLGSLIAGAAVGYLGRSEPERRVVRSAILPPVKSMFMENGTAYGAVALSPDGRQLVVGITNESGRPMLYLRALSSLTGQTLEGTEGGSYPFWSQDNRSIGFFADGQLKRIDLASGSVQTICTAPEGRGATWSKEGVILFAGTITSAISRVAATGGTPVAITKFDGAHHENSHRWPHFLPDGNHFLYLARSGDLANSAVSVGSLDGMAPKRLATTVGNPSYGSGYLVYPKGTMLMAQRFDADKLSISGEAVAIGDGISTNGNVQQANYSISLGGELIYLASEGAGRTNLEWVSREGKVVRLIDQDATFYAPSLSPDGTKLAVARSGDQNQANTDIWIFDLKTQAKTRLTFSPPGGTESNRMPVWSPDGKRIAFTSYRDGRYQVYVKAVSGLGEETLVYPIKGERNATSWSPDGKYLVAIQEGADFGTHGIVVIPMTSDEKPFPIMPTLQGVTLFTLPRISPDGKWLAYMASESGRAEVYITSFPKGEGKWQVSNTSGLMPVWSRDGKEIFYLSATDTLNVADITYSGEAPVIGTPRKLFWIPLVSSSNWSYDVAPDGKSFLVDSVIYSANGRTITLVENWDAGLGRK